MGGGFGARDGGAKTTNAAGAPGRAGLRPLKGRGRSQNRTEQNRKWSPLTKIRTKPTQKKGNRVTEKLKK